MGAAGRCPVLQLLQLLLDLFVLRCGASAARDGALAQAASLNTRSWRGGYANS